MVKWMRWKMPSDFRENKTFIGEEALLTQRGVKLDLLQDQSCIEMMNTFISDHPELWNEDIGK